jgi:hypothetical protein
MLMLDVKTMCIWLTSAPLKNTWHFNTYCEWRFSFCLVSLTFGLNRFPKWSNQSIIHALSSGPKRYSLTNNLTIGLYSTFGKYSDPLTFSTFCVCTCIRLSLCMCACTCEHRSKQSEIRRTGKSGRLWVYTPDICSPLSLSTAGHRMKHVQLCSFGLWPGLLK